jgi:hypothetical protein
MKRKPIRIDWDELESAFDNDREDFVHYLDLVTGQVYLDGEGEEEAVEGDEDEVDGPEPVLGEIPARLAIDPASPDERLNWMEDFVHGEAIFDDAARARLDEILSRSAADEFREALRKIEGARERWFAYRTERLHQRIDEWLAANGVATAEPPPWK